MSSKISFRRQGPEAVVLSHSRTTELWGLLFQLAFFALWYWILLGRPKTVAAFIDAIRGIPDSGISHWAFLAFPLLWLPPCQPSRLSEMA